MVVGGKKETEKKGRTYHSIGAKTAPQFASPYPLNTFNATSLVLGATPRVCPPIIPATCVPCPNSSSSTSLIKSPQPPQRPRPSMIRSKLPVPCRDGRVDHVHCCIGMLVDVSCFWCCGFAVRDSRLALVSRGGEGEYFGAD